MAIVCKVLLIAILVVMLLPLWVMVSGSFQPIKYMLTMPPRLIPLTVTLDNYRLLLADIPFWSWAANTMVVVVGIAAGAIFLSATGGYGFAVYQFKGRAFAMAFLLSLIMIPSQVLVIPTFIMFRTVGIANSYAAAILPKVLTVMGIFLFKNYIEHIPRAIIDSGRIDGAKEWRIMIQLVMPQCKPVIGVIALFYGIVGFQDFLWQLLTMRKHKTLLVGLILHIRALTITHNGIGMGFAVGTILFVPMLLIYIFTSRLFIEGLNLSGMRE